MAIRTLLKFRNLDLTKDINDRYTRLITPGIFDGGEVVPVTGTLRVEIVAPWKLVSKDGMVIEETSDNTRLTIPTIGRTYVVAVKVVYVENNDPIVEIGLIELTAFELLTDKEYYVIFAHIVVPADAISILSSYIQYANRDIVDKLGRNSLRGVVTSYSVLPDAKDNVAGDLYIVANGVGGIPHIWGWSGSDWIILTDAATVTANLALHRGNNDAYLHDDEMHVTVDQQAALVGTSGTLPSASNPYIDDADLKIPTQDENNALQGTDGGPSDTNRYITEEYPWAIPEEILVTNGSGSTHLLPAISDICTKLTAPSDGPFYIGHFNNSSEQVPNYFKLYDPTLNREYTTSTTHPTSPNSIVTITGVYKNISCTTIVEPINDSDYDGFCSVDLYLKWDVTPDTEFKILYGKKELMKKIGDPEYHPFPDAFLRRKASDAQVPASIIKAIQDIKGRDFDDVPPISEQNISLRGNVVGTKEYVGAVFKSDNVLGDFKSVEGIPVFANDFSTNIGIPQNYTFENTMLSSISYSYDQSTGIGTVSYGSVSVDLISVIANQDVFIDGSLNEYKVTSVNTGNRTIQIQKRNGKVPRFDPVGGLNSVNTTVSLSGLFSTSSKIVTGISPNTTGLVTSMAIKGTASVPSGTIIASVDSSSQITLSNTPSIGGTSAFVAIPNTMVNNYYIRGSIKKDNNPRKINLATTKYLFGREIIYCRQIKPVPNEFHPTTGNVAFEIFSPIKSATHREPRIRFYGGFKNKEYGNRGRIVCTGTGTILVTGFFTHLCLIADLKNPTNVFTVKVDGEPIGTTISPTNIADTNNFDNELDLQHQYLKIAGFSSSLSDLIPHTVEISLSNVSDDCFIYGLDLTRNATTVAVLPGRAFCQSDLYQKNSLQSSITAPISTFTRCRGVVSTRYVNRQLVESTQTTTLYDLDGLTCPDNIVALGQKIFGSTNTKLAYYQVGDITKLIIYDSLGIDPTYERVMVIQSVASGQVEFSTNIDGGGSGSRYMKLLHVASTTGDIYDQVKEFNRYTITDLGVRQTSDFAYLLQSGSSTSKVFTLEDGTTNIAAQVVSYVNTGIEGADLALNFTGASSTLRIRAVASQLDIIYVNSSTVSGTISIDGSPNISASFAGGGLSKYTLWSNARYQSHEAYISSATGLSIVGFIVYEPTHNVKLEGSLLATQNVIASYDSSLAGSSSKALPVGTDDSIMPTGVIAINPYKFGGNFVNSGGGGTDWTTTINFTSNPYWGRYINTTQVNAYFEYTFLGTGFEIEYLTLNDRKVAEIYIDNTLATTVNFSGVSFKNIYQESPNPTYNGGSYIAGQVDMYENTATPYRRKFGMYGLTFGMHTVKVLYPIGTGSGIWNTGSTGSGGINICTVYEINSNGYLSYSPSKGFRGKVGVDEYIYGLDWVRDERVFDSGFAVKEEMPSLIQTNTQSVAMVDIRTDKIPLTIGLTTLAVSFITPFTDNDYFLDCRIIGSGGTSVLNVSAVNLTSTGFTAYFTSVPGTYLYYLTYTATKYL